MRPQPERGARFRRSSRTGAGRVRRSVGLAWATLLAAGLLALGGPAAPADAQETGSLQLEPLQVATAGQSACGPAGVSALGVACVGSEGREVLELPDLWLVGYQNDQERGEKHVRQTVFTFDLAPLRSLPSGATIDRAVLSYAEISTVHRSDDGQDSYGILPTCATSLGVPVAGWDGGLDQVIPTAVAEIAGATSATTGGLGSWDVTPQLQLWLTESDDQRTFVLRSDDESLFVKGQASCLSYLSDLNLAVEYTVQPEG